MKDAFTKFVGVSVITIVAAVILMLPAIWLHGWVLVTLWGWFVVPLFHLPPLTIIQGLGLYLAVVMIRPPANFSIKDDGYTSTERLQRLFGKLFLGPLFILGLASILHFYF